MPMSQVIETPMKEKSAADRFNASNWITAIATSAV